jgi:hypothetical protein
MDAILEGQPPLFKERQDAPHGMVSDEQTPDSEVIVYSDDTDVLINERDIATHVITIDDDTSSSPWTYRAFIIGLGLSVFSGALGKYLVGGLT